MALAPKQIGSQTLRRGDIVEVRSVSEILETLDADGKLDGIPFMPEMAKFCGHRFTVFRRADKTCVEGHHIRSLGDAVFLAGVRCDGGQHDGCQRGCLVFWRTQWLKRVEPDAAWTDGAANDSHAADVAALTTRRGDRYVCQSTELAAATSHISRWNPWPYVQDMFVGEATPWQLLKIVGRMGANHVRRYFGRMPRGEHKKTPRGALGLQAGDWVRVRSREEIEATLDADGKNRGLLFESEMLDHCGQRHQVAFTVSKIILEESGKMLPLTETVVLQGLACRGTCAKNCPRSNYYYWRELWLERIEPPENEAVRRGSDAHSGCTCPSDLAQIG